MSASSFLNAQVDAKIDELIRENEVSLREIIANEDGLGISEARKLLCELRSVKKDFKVLKRLEHSEMRKGIRKERKRKMKENRKKTILKGVQSEGVDVITEMMAGLKL